MLKSDGLPLVCISSSVLVPLSIINQQDVFKVEKWEENVLEEV